MTMNNVKGASCSVVTRLLSALKSIRAISFFQVIGLVLQQTNVLLFHFTVTTFISVGSS